jgi:hypothetical protein
LDGDWFTPREVAAVPIDFGQGKYFPGKPRQWGVPMVLAFASDWKREVNGRWGFALTYPASLIAEPAPSDGAGRRYHSADNAVSLSVMGSHTHPEEFLENFWQKELSTRGETVTPSTAASRSASSKTTKGALPPSSSESFLMVSALYKFKKDNYYVISGVNPNGYEFYHKVFFYPTYWLEFEITYPHAKHAVYDAWVERIARDFVPALPDNGQYDR